MIERILHGVRSILRLNAPGRNLLVFPDDVFIVSYPKSGNTWTRFLIGNLVHPEAAADFSNIDSIIPDPELLSKRRLENISRPRIIKSHQYFDHRYRKVIYVVRDPRDVVLSQYHFHRKRKYLADGAPMENFVTRFIAGETSVYGSWAENVASWFFTRNGNPDFLLVRYEDLLAGTMQELSKIADFLGIDAPTSCLQQAVERSSSNEMRKLEKEQSHLWALTRKTRGDIPFVRAAKAGGWKAELTPTVVSQIEAAWGPLMQLLGYEISVGRNLKAEATELVAAAFHGSRR